jgi:hypothetical protein
MGAAEAPLDDRRSKKDVFAAGSRSELRIPFASSSLDLRVSKCDLEHNVQ